MPSRSQAKRASATRVESGVIALDGRLSEEVWRASPAVTDFVQKEPTQGAPPTDDMELRFAYDDRAFYVGARMASHNARGIQAPLGRRDLVDQAERILVSLDTFHDRRTSIVFGVTAAGVRMDRFHGTDHEESFDATYDLVWDAATTMDADGWSVEIWIPFAQLRFNPEQDLQPENALALAGNTLLRFRGGQIRAAGGRWRLGREWHGAGHRARAALERALRAAPRPHLFAARSYAHVARRLDRAGELRSHRRPALAVGGEHEDRLGELRDQRLRDPERRRWLAQ